MKVYIGITSKDRFSYLKKCISSIEENTAEIDYSLIISDDGSTDRRIKKFLMNADLKNLEQVFFRKVPAGITHSVDVMLKYIEFNKWFFDFNNKKVYFCYLQDDTIIQQKGWLTTLIQAYDALKEKHHVGFFSGFVAPEHRTLFVDNFNSIPVFIKQSTRATNLIGTLEHWQSCGLPHRVDVDGKLRGFPGVVSEARRGSNFDVFLTGGNSYGIDKKFSSKTSNFNQGKTILAIDLIKHTAHTKDDSTWKNENEEYKEDIRVLVGVSEGIGNLTQSLPAVNLIKSLHPTFNLDIVYLDGTKKWFCEYLFKKDSAVKALYDWTNFPLDKKYYGAYILASTKKDLPKDCKFTNLSKIKLSPNDYKLWSSNSEVLLNIASVCGLSKNRLNMNLDDSTIFGVSKYLLPEYFNKSMDNLILFHNGYNKDGKIVDFWKAKSYECFSEVAVHFKNKGFSVGCIGSRDEYIPGCIDYTGIPIEQSIGLINNCKVFVSNDTGTYHIAAALNKPGVVVFTMTSQKKNHDIKFHKSIQIVNRDPGCGVYPCQMHKDKFWHEQCKEHKCKDIPPQLIITKIEEILNQIKNEK